MNKIDEIVEKISPSSQINADLIDAIDLEEFIIRVINNSQLSCRKMAVAARIVSKRVFWETTSLFMYCYSAVDGEHHG